MGIGGPRFHRGILNLNLLPNLGRRNQKAQDLSFRKVKEHGKQIGPPWLQGWRSSASGLDQVEVVSPQVI